MAHDIASLITAWSIPFWGSWSIMKIFFVFVLITAIVAVYQYYFSKAGGE